MIKLSNASLLFAASTTLGCARGNSTDSTPNASAPGRVKTIVLVHGSFADGSSWGKVIPLLEARGYRVVAVQEPLTSLADDVAATRRAIDPHAQAVMAERAGAKITNVASSHVSMLSHPHEVAASILEAARSA